MRVHILSSRTGRSAELLRKILPCEVYSEICPERWRPGDVVVSLGYMKRIPRGVYNEWFTVNVHPGPLDELPGKHPQLRALADLGRTTTRVVLHQIQSDAYDVGEELASIEVAITEEDRDEPPRFLQRTRLIGVHLLAAWLIGQGAEYYEL